MRRGVVMPVLAIVGVGLFPGDLAWLLNDPHPTAGASRGERLYYADCVERHERGGPGSWRAALPGPLTPAADEVYQQFVMVDALAGFWVDELDLEGAVKWGEDKIEAVHAKFA